jgi:hypothetical protein
MTVGHRPLRTPPRRRALVRDDFFAATPSESKADNRPTSQTPKFLDLHAEWSSAKATQAPSGFGRRRLCTVLGNLSAAWLVPWAGAIVGLFTGGLLVGVLIGAGVGFVVGVIAIEVAEYVVEGIVRRERRPNIDGRCPTSSVSRTASSRSPVRHRMKTASTSQCSTRSHRRFDPSRAPRR